MITTDAIPEDIGTADTRPIAPSSRSAGQRVAEAAKRNPVAVAAAAGTGGILGVTTLIEVLKSLHEIGGSGVIWQVSALVTCVLWIAATYAGWQGRLAQTRSQDRLSEAARVREIYQDAADRAERREEKVMSVIESAIVELKNGQAQLVKTVGDLTGEVRALYGAIDSETARRLRERTGASSK